MSGNSVERLPYPATHLAMADPGTKRKYSEVPAPIYTKTVTRINDVRSSPAFHLVFFPSTWYTSITLYCRALEECWQSAILVSSRPRLHKTSAGIALSTSHVVGTAEAYHKHNIRVTIIALDPRANYNQTIDAGSTGSTRKRTDQISREHHLHRSPVHMLKLRSSRVPSPFCFQCHQ
ncbi:hypothetical protein BDV97DRAFT_373158 [Delphinella strobiligena]|nr:hypothetical protein BDV97DRAFT_373158 [Delphinella strobiligena]